MRRPRRIVGSVPTIAPVPTASGDDRPFWSVMIPNHDRADLLAATLASVLAQDPGPDVMQIEVIDDASTKDDPESVVRDLAGDRVGFHRHARNRGAPATFTTAVERARGRWVHILHSDDVVLPGFYDSYRAVIERRPCVMVVGRTVQIDGTGQHRSVSSELLATDGLLDDAWHTLALRHMVDFPAVVVARGAYEQVGGFHPGLVHANDWEMWTRIAATGPVGAVEVPLAGYRQHAGSDTSQLQRTTLYLRDPLAALELVAARAPSADHELELRQARRRSMARQARSVGRRHAVEGRLGPALTSATWSVRLDPSARAFATAARTAALAVWRSVGQPPTGGAIRLADPQVADGTTSL